MTELGCERDKKEALPTFPLYTYFSLTWEMGRRGRIGEERRERGKTKEWKEECRREGEIEKERETARNGDLSRYDS